MRYTRALPMLLALPLAAHNYPMTHGTLTILEGGARLVLRLPVHHFHPALERFAECRLAPKDGEGYPVELLEGYFRGTLELRTMDGAALTFSVVKQDLDPHDLRVTLEVRAPSLKGSSLRNTILFEAEPKEKNLVTVEGLGPRLGLTFDRKHPVQVLP